MITVIGLGVVALFIIYGVLLTAVGLRHGYILMAALGLATQLTMFLCGIALLIATPEKIMDRAEFLVGWLLVGFIVFTFMGKKMFAPKPEKG